MLKNLLQMAWAAITYLRLSFKLQIIDIKRSGESLSSI
ncbi:hypothetical protein APA_2843 [Pseudanabaena sp. lw0831]|nr:hypothetical protein APA_2843 [Pseudanabaena sp. lw0831]